MFPNVRLLVAATFVSILAVIFGFGMLAAVRANHAPLVRLPPTAATRFATDDGAPPIMAFAAVEPGPFDHRFPATLPPSTHAVTATPARVFDPADGIEALPAASATRPDDGDVRVVEAVAMMSEPEPVALASAPPISVPASAAAPSPPAPNTPDAGVSPAPPGSPAAQPAQASTEQSGDVAATESQTPVAPAPQQPAPNLAPAPQASPNAAAADAGGNQEPASAPIDVAAATPPEDQALPADQSGPEGLTASDSIANAAAKTDAEPKRHAGKKAKHEHAHRKHRASRKVASGTQATPYASSMQPDFVTAPEWQQSQSARKRAARRASVTLASRKSKDSVSTSNSADSAWPNQ